MGLQRCLPAHPHLPAFHSSAFPRSLRSQRSQLGHVSLCHFSRHAPRRAAIPLRSLARQTPPPTRALPCRGRREGRRAPCLRHSPARSRRDAHRRRSPPPLRHSAAASCLPRGGGSGGEAPPRQPPAGRGGRGEGGELKRRGRAGPGRWRRPMEAAVAAGSCTTRTVATCCGSGCCCATPRRRSAPWRACRCVRGGGGGGVAGGERGKSPCPGRATREPGSVARSPVQQPVARFRWMGGGIPSSLTSWRDARGCPPPKKCWRWSHLCGAYLTGANQARQDPACRVMNLQM